MTTLEEFKKLKWKKSGIIPTRMIDDLITGKNACGTITDPQDPRIHYYETGGRNRCLVVTGDMYWEAFIEDYD